MFAEDAFALDSILQYSIFELYKDYKRERTTEKEYIYMFYIVINKNLFG